MLNKYAWYIKLSSWEYWPMWVLYIPVYVQHIWLSIKARNAFFIYKANPAIDEGFILCDSKFKTQQIVPEEYLPKTIFVAKSDTLNIVLNQLNTSSISFPIILKPDIGFRGLLVHKINDKEHLESVLKTISVDHIIQEYVDYPVEVGVFYYRLPQEKKGNIPSITVKEFLSVTGNGKNTLSELIKMKPRAILQLEILQNKFSTLWNEIIPTGKEIVLEAIGNHNRGTKFINGNHLYCQELQDTFDELNKRMDGFYFGRFDIRAKSIEDLKQGKNFKILEVNGVGAEPTHVYDPNYKLIAAWKDMLHLWKVIYKIAMQNKKQGEKFPVFLEARKRWRSFKEYRKVAFEN